jgi:hypothetical protein
MWFVFGGSGGDFSPPKPASRLGLVAVGVPNGAPGSIAYGTKHLNRVTKHCFRARKPPDRHQNVRAREGRRERRRRSASRSGPQGGRSDREARAVEARVSGGRPGPGPARSGGNRGGTGESPTGIENWLTPEAAVQSAGGRLRPAGSRSTDRGSATGRLSTGGPNAGGTATL